MLNFMASTNGPGEHKLARAVAIDHPLYRDHILEFVLLKTTPEKRTG